MHTNVPRHARVSNFEVTFWLTYFQNTANTMKSRRSLEKKLHFGRGTVDAVAVIGCGCGCGAGIAGGAGSAGGAGGAGGSGTMLVLHQLFL